MDEMSKNPKERKIKSLTFNDLTMIYVRFLRIIGILPFEGKDVDFIGSYLLVIIMVSSELMHNAMFVGCINHRLRKGTLGINVISEIVCSLGTTSKYLLLLWLRIEFRGAMQDCRDLWEKCTESEHQIIKLFEKRSRTLFKLFISNCIFIVIMYPFTALITKLPSTEPNGTFHRPLPYKWFVDDVDDKSMSYAGIFLMQVIVVNNSCVITAGCDIAAPFVMMITCGFLRTLQERLLQATETKDTPNKYDDSNYEELIDCLKFHQSILSLCEKIEKFARSLFLVQLLCTGYNISLAGIKLVSSDPDKFNFIPMLATFIVQLYICQWASDFILEESSATSTAVYFSSVKRMNHRCSKILLIMLARAQRPVQITAGGIVNLSLENFGSIITNAVSFFTVLRNFNI